MTCCDRLPSSSPGALAIATFVGRQLWLQRAGTPLMDLRVLKHRTFTLSLSLMSVAFMAMLGSMILLPLYLQNLRDLSPLQTGLLVMPGGLAMGLLGPERRQDLRPLRRAPTRHPGVARHRGRPRRC